MKKFAALFLSLLLVLTMTSALAETDITLWTFPIGDWGNSEKVDEMLAAPDANNFTQAALAQGQESRPV